MSTSKLHKSQPILALFAPTGANGAPFSQPAKSALNDPTTSRMLVFLSNRVREWFASPPSVGNIPLITSLADQLMNIRRIVRFIQTKMFLLVGRGNHNGNDQFSHRPFIMSIGSGDVDGQRRTPLVNQEMNFRPSLASVSWIASCIRTVQRGRNRFAIDSLPFPTDALLSMIEACQGTENLVPDTLLLPCLEPLMQDAAGDTKPCFVNRFPLASCPQNVPEAIDNGAIINARSTGGTLLGLLG